LGNISNSQKGRNLSGREMVEVEGIEPSSRDKKTRISTHLACLLISRLLSDRQDRKRVSKVCFSPYSPLLRVRLSLFSHTSVTFQGKK